MLFMALVKGMLSVKLTKVEGGWLLHSGMTGSMSEVGFGCYDRLAAENAKGRMGNIVGGGEPTTWCD
jgi:hypothetical protein